ncbi:MAG: ion transporter [Rhodospirillales bacterium]|nr:ion transporter [Rhodospirillales bacterium]
MPNTWRARFADLLEEAERPSRVRIVANLTLLMAIAVAVAAAMVETMNDVPLPVTLAAGRLSATASVLFTVEYILRLWVVPERAPAASVSARRARWVYARGFLGAVDLLVILPFWLEHFIPLGRDWFEIAGLLAILKLARYAPGLGLVARVFANEIRALSAAFIVLFVVLVLASGVMYTLESHAQPQAFSSIPATMWWGIVTMGTVGYGDMVPLTPLGRLFGSFIILLGVAVYAEAGAPQGRGSFRGGRVAERQHAQCDRDRGERLPASRPRGR